MTKVAVVGPEDNVKDCLACANEFPNLILDGFPYEREKQTKEIIKSIAEQYKIILFTGPIPYYEAKELSKELPILKNIHLEYIRFNRSCLYRALFRLRHLEDFTRLSIDTIPKQDIEIAFGELEIEDTTPYILEYDHLLTQEQLVQFHKKLFDKGKTDYALTSLRSAYMELKKLGVPTLRIYALRSEIIKALSRVNLIRDNIWQKSFHITVGMIAIDGYDTWERDKDFQEIQQFNIQVSQSLLKFIKQIDGHLEKMAPGKYLFFTTRALMEKVTDQFTLSPSIELLNNNLTLSMGIGIGGSANIAADNAKLALQRAKEQGGNATFVVNENKQIIGPLDGQKKNIIETKFTDEFVFELAEKTGLSTYSINKILDAVSSVGTEFTAHDITPYLNMTLRSSRRLLKRLEESGVISIVGQESPYSHGKPRRVYRFNRIKDKNLNNS